MVVPRHEVVGHRVVSPLRKVRQVLQSFELEGLPSQVLVNISHVNRQPEQSVPRFGTTPRGLTTIGFSPWGYNVTASAASISSTAPETNSLGSNAEGALANSRLGGGDTVHRRR